MKKDEFMRNFINQYMGRGIDFDGAYGVQCVDGAKIGLGLLGCTQFPAIGDAIAYWTNYNAHPFIRENMTRVYTTSDLDVGDLVVMSTPADTGHICWYAGDGKVFGQNQDGRHDGFSLRPLTNWTFAGAHRFNGFDDFSEPVKGIDGVDMHNEYEDTNFATNFATQFGNAFGTAFAQAINGKMWRSNQSNEVYFPFDK